MLFTYNHLSSKMEKVQLLSKHLVGTVNSQMNPAAAFPAPKGLNLSSEQAKNYQKQKAIKVLALLADHQ